MMSDRSLWGKFATYGNFLLAWQRTVNVTSLMIEDEIGMEAFGYNLQASLEDLLRRVMAEDFPYSPLADHKVYVPKPSTTLRTMSLMSVPDVIVYQALVNVIADESHLHLVTHEDQHVLGNLYAGPGKRWMLKRWRDMYRRFGDQVEKLYRAGNPWIASTDIVAFYDTIDHQRLLGRVREYCGEDQKFEGLLRECLAKWSAHSPSVTMSRGIPQGSNASDYLANLYLLDIDREMIAQGYRYVRYVDDVRILGPDKATVQRGLICFDMELKRAGLVPQVTKTTVHKIENIDEEILRLRFFVTDPTADGGQTATGVDALPTSEQAASVVDRLQGELSCDKQSGGVSPSDEDGPAPPKPTADSAIGSAESPRVQEQLVTEFLENYTLLDDPEKGKNAESTITYCLFGLHPSERVRDLVLDLLPRLPWRSRALACCLGRYKQDPVVAERLRTFVSEHEVYSWHRANVLETLSEVLNAKSVSDVCREWLSDSDLDWYARTVAARILAKVPSQHAFLVERLRCEQNRLDGYQEETAILRQELAWGAFQRIRSVKKQLALFHLICKDRSPIVRRLAVYLLQQRKCRVTWDDLAHHHECMSEWGDLVTDLGLSASVAKPCFIAQTSKRMYEVSLPVNDLRPYYKGHHEDAAKHLRESVSAYHESPNAYVRCFHQFAHLSLIAFYQWVLPSESGLYEGYGRLTNRGVLTNTLPRGVPTWKRLGSLRNRVDHPVDRTTKTHSKRITYKEMEDLHKELQVALQEIFDVWLNAEAPPLAGEHVELSEPVVAAESSE